MEDWVVELQGGRPDAAWDRFLERYRRLIFAAIRHYAQDYDDVMDVFARVCEALREDDLARLRCYAEQPVHTARFSTWLVTVVRHLTIDWFRHRDGRRRLSALAERLPPLPPAFSASRIRRPSTAGYTAHSARCGEAWSRPAFTQETCSNPPAAVRLKERAETSTLPTRTLRRLQARRVHEVRIRTRRAAARARPGQLPRRLDQRAHPTGPPRSARFAA